MRRLLEDERGSVAILVALLISALLGFGALAVDYSHSSYVKVKLQSAADAAALAAVQALPDTAAATAAALDLAGKNVPGDYGTVTRSADVVFGAYDLASGTFSAGASPQNAVQVTASRTTSTGNAAPVFLAQALGRTSVDVSTRSIAYRGSTGPASCVFVLDPNAVSALSIGGSGDFNVPNCGVQVNSGHNKAASASNGSDSACEELLHRRRLPGQLFPRPHHRLLRGGRSLGCGAGADPRGPVVQRLQDIG
jgi:Flp pilus assembly protein TadG